MPVRVLVAGLLLACVSVAASAASTPAPALSWKVGETIYRDGQLPDGQPLTGTHPGGAVVTGQAAACMNCHQRSGLGSREGRIAIPPIAGMYLFNPHAGNGDESDLPYVETMRREREPYTDATLARAIRNGVGVDGKTLIDLMPRYTLDNRQMAALIAYLRKLSPTSTPGAGETILHFATIVTPEADPVLSDGVQKVLERFVEDKNHYTGARSGRLQSSHLLRFRANRHWQLHVWKLQGPPSGWEAQLDKYLEAQPVLAVVASTGGRHWRPVHEFCEREEVPCLFPIIDEPVVEANTFDNVYFSRGVLLEADLMAEDLLKRLPDGAAGGRLVQVFRDGDVGEDAAAALASRMNDKLPTSDIRLPRQATPKEIATALGQVHPGDVLALWLRPADLAALGPVPAGVSVAYVSGRMGGLEEAPLSAPWRAITRMAYPFELPEHRRVQIDYPLGWFRLRRIQVVALQAQADAYLACIILSDTLNHMADSFVRDYLVERVQEAVAHRILTGYYPRLGLALREPFASKGGYIVRFAGPTGDAIVAETAWITP